MKNTFWHGKIGVKKCTFITQNFKTLYKYKKMYKTDKIYAEKVFQIGWNMHKRLLFHKNTFAKMINFAQE